MMRRSFGILSGIGLCSLALLIGIGSNTVPEQTAVADGGDKNAGSARSGEYVPSSLEEARARARLLYETIDGALQVMHRDLFDDEKSLIIPSRSLEDVFRVLERKHHVSLRWLAVNANAMSVDHTPENDFERAAAKAITAGQTEYEAVEEGTFRYVGMIRLGSECLKCHVPMRKSLEDRFAGLVISMPFQKK
ncbi:MAG TPA: DUF3365 domain-containing protein [Planctomicrobium sp.]|nr:DUF3365 domain-containing protein [Planctomicrobium sp.]